MASKIFNTKAYSHYVSTAHVTLAIQCRAEKEFYLHSFTSKEAYRGKGYASKVLSAVCHEADRKKYKLILHAHAEPWSNALTQEQLLEFYKRKGFEFNGDLGIRNPPHNG